MEEKVPTIKNVTQSPLPGAPNLPYSPLLPLFPGAPNILLY